VKDQVLHPYKTAGNPDVSREEAEGQKF